jgi:hypothetical protein
MVHRIPSHLRVEIEALDKTRRGDDNKMFDVQNNYLVCCQEELWLSAAPETVYQFPEEALEGPAMRKIWPINFSCVSIDLHSTPKLSLRVCIDKRKTCISNMFSKV